jgi:RNase P subunit RPR2
MTNNQISFKGQTIILEDPKRGVCNLCRAVIPFDCKKTLMHHESYHDNDPLKDTIELCVSCHKKRHSEINEKRDKLVRIRSRLYDEMVNSALAKQFGVDFDDICSEVWESWKREHRKGND